MCGYLSGDVNELVGACDEVGHPLVDSELRHWVFHPDSRYFTLEQRSLDRAGTIGGSFLALSDVLEVGEVLAEHLEDGEGDGEFTLEEALERGLVGGLALLGLARDTTLQERHEKRRVSECSGGRKEARAAGQQLRVSSRQSVQAGRQADSVDQQSRVQQRQSLCLPRIHGPLVLAH